LDRQRIGELVGDIDAVDTTVLRKLLDNGLMPVVSPLSADESGTLLNINADTVAAALGAALGAEKLVLCTGAPGILGSVDDPGSLISYTDLRGLKRLREEGRIHDGMLPKAKAIEDAIRGDPRSPLRWVSRSQRQLSKALTALGFHVSQRLVGKLLRELDYSCQANRKTREGSNHPDRNAQFEHINTTVQAAIAAGEPAISVDTKKKELVGDFKNNGRELRPKGNPEPVRVHDFKIPELGKVAPYGVYDIAANHGWVSVGISADTGAFAVESIRRWWYKLGNARYPDATRLTITADCGGSNGPQVKLWKRELQRLANETGLKITVTHL